MHMVIYALVEASTHDDALATGTTVFDRLVGADPYTGAVFDYYATFDEEASWCTLAASSVLSKSSLDKLPQSRGSSLS